MRAITLNAIREKVRKKELYVIALIGILVILLITTGTGTISLNGVPITAYQNIIPILIVVTNAVCGVLAITLSLRTIPNEYSRKTSHLIWMRKISQTRYHGALAAANICITILAVAIMYVGIFIYILVQGEYEGAVRAIPAFIISCLSVIIISLLTSALSIKLPSAAAGSIAAFVYIVGILHELLDVYRGMIDGAAKIVLKILLIIVPDLHSIQAEAGKMIIGGVLNISTIIKALFIVYIITLLFVLFKRKEA